MKNNKSLLKLKLLSFLFIVLPFEPPFSQESQIIKKIIIEKNLDDGRLLSPPTEKDNNVIKLIPPKSVLEKEAQKDKEIKLQDTSGIPLITRLNTWKPIFFQATSRRSYT